MGVSGASTSAQILGNSIYSNTQIGIDLGTNGATANDGGDGDSGPNTVQNYPTATGFSWNGVNFGVTNLNLDSAAGWYRIEFFASPTNDGEGQRYLGSYAMQPGAPFTGTIAGIGAVNSGEYITMTATQAGIGGVAPYANTSEFSAPVLATVTAGPYSISGTIYNDVDGDAVVAEIGEGTFRTVTVRLYQDDGDGVIEATDALVTSTTTNASGAYTFTGLANATYWVTVDSRTIGSPLDVAYKAGFDATYVWAEQTYGDNALTGALDPGARYGGLNAGTSDNAAAGLASAEHVSRAVVSGASVTGVDSGFSYSAIVNNRGDATDDDAGNPRLQQGSLRQFIMNSNDLAGTQTSSFAIAGAGVRTITLASVLPDITDTVVLDAWSEGVFQGTPGYNGVPLIEINANGASIYGLHLFTGSSGSTIRGFVLNRATSDGIGVDFSNSNVIQGNYIGTNAAGTPTADRQQRRRRRPSTRLDATTPSAGPAPAQRNVISGNAGDGIVVNGTTRTTTWSSATTSAPTRRARSTWATARTACSSASARRATPIGGTTAAERNVISGNNADGVSSSAPPAPATSSRATTSAPTPPARRRSATSSDGVVIISGATATRSAARRPARAT